MVFTLLVPAHRVHPRWATDYVALVGLRDGRLRELLCRCWKDLNNAAVRSGPFATVRRALRDIGWDWVWPLHWTRPGLPDLP
eukprot:2665853-Alexandrium_andersonii.AAC.1